MIIIRNLNDICGQLRNPSVTIGNFDGVHLGHREIFRRVREAAASLSGVSVVVTFEPHPLKLFPRVNNLRLITTYTEKEGLIESSGIDYLITIPFTEEFAALSAADFVSGILVDLIGLKKLIIGYDYAFGRNREGNVALLREMGHRCGFDLEVLAPIGDGREVYSSTRIREMIGAGDVKGVVALLGRHHFLDGTVIHGHHRGKAIGFPTANLSTENELIPHAGVYAVKIKVADRIYDGACSIGSNPTFGDVTTALEVFIFDFNDDLYGTAVRVFFIDRIRNECKFNDVGSLQEAIRADVIRCRGILAESRVIEYHVHPESLSNGEK